MEKTQTGLGIYYDHTKLQDKYFFGGFFNLAQNNIDNVIKAFIIKFFPERKDKDINIAQFLDICFKDNDADSDFQKKNKFLRIHFPVIGFLTSDNDKAGFKKKFALLLKTISELRNFYTHYYHKSIEFPSELFELLDDIFVKTTSEIKKLKKKDDKTQQLLNKNLSEEYDIRYQQQIERLKELKAQGKRVSLTDETAIRNGVFNAAFNHLIYRDGENVKPSRLYQSSYSEPDPAENGISLSQNSILFLLSMFLERKETEDLKSRVKGFKAKIIKQGEEQISGLKFMATHWVFSYLCFKGIKQKLSTEFHEETLLIQIIDELSKVPDEVYSAFDSKTKEKFLEDINEYMKEGNADLSLEDSKVIHPVIRKRYENKFNYFAIRFLDEYLSSTSLKFQVHVGNYVHDRRVKHINGTGFQTERIVKDRIKVFGRLSNISNLKADYIKEQLELPNDSNGWEIFPNPSYIFIDNNVPIHVLADEATKKGIELFKDKRRKEQPEELQKRKGKISKYNIVSMIYKEAKGKDKLRIDEPLALLSLNEIPALLYQILEKGATPKDIELIIKNKLTERFEKIKNYDPETPAPASQISKRLRNNTTAKGQEALNAEKLSLLIEREIENTETKLSSIEEKRLKAKKEQRRNTPQRSIFSNSDLGRIAAWLADDIKRFMPAEQRKNWKGYQHSQLQQSLAYFEKRPQEAFLLLKEGWDTSDGSSYWNNWVMNSFLENNHFEKFYKNYLMKRVKYFSELAGNIKQHTHNTKFLRKFIKQQMPADLFPKRHYILKDLETEKNKVLSKPLVFSRGLFDNNPTFIKGVKVTENPELFAEWYSYGYKTEHVFQHFYGWERDYNELLDSELQKGNSFAKNSIYYNRESQLDLIKLKQDLKIKKIKIQDLFLKRIAEKLFENVFNYPTTLSLDEFYLTQEERAEKERIALAQSLREEGDNSPNIIKDDFIWSKTIAFRSKQIYEPAIKLKDIGKFNRFVLDDEESKASKLLSYDKNKIWNKEQLERELSIGENSYEVIRREKLFKEIQNLELQILSNWSWDGINHPREFEMEDQKNTRHPNFKMYLVNGILRKNINLYKEDEDFWLESLKENDFKTLPSEVLETKSEMVQLLFLVILIRNQFAHNQLPEIQFYNFIRKNYPEIQNNTVAELYLNLIKLAVQKLKDNS